MRLSVPGAVARQTGEFGDAGGLKMAEEYFSLAAGARSGVETGETIAPSINLRVMGLVTALAVVAGPAGAGGGTIRHDRTDAEYIGLAAAHPQVGALISSDQAGATHLCGGTLIDPQWVLTAAQCVDGARASITFITGADILLGQDQSVTADAWFPHPQWDRSRPQQGLPLSKPYPP